MIDPNVRSYVETRIARRAQRSDKAQRAALAASAASTLAAATALVLQSVPRRASLTLADVAVGTQTKPITWTVPIAGDYTVVTSPITTGPFVGLLTATLQAGSKQPGGCTLIVANRSALVIGAASIDVLIFPLPDASDLPAGGVIPNRGGA